MEPASQSVANLDSSLQPSADGAPSERELLRLLLRAGTPIEERSGSAVAWTTLAFDAGRLRDELRRWQPADDPAAARRLDEVAIELAARYRLQVGRVDDLALPVAGHEVHIPRTIAGEALGPLGADLFPNRRRARRLATEGARELAYFGYGRLEEQLLPSPITLIQAALSGQPRGEVEPVLLLEEGPLGRQAWSVFDLLTDDPFFHRKVPGRTELARLQQRLREDPLDGSMVSKLRDFFSRRLTVGVRDTMRWALGSRHPWFDWPVAREMLTACFERWGAESFLSPRLTLYTWDAELDDELLREMIDQNGKVARLFAERIAEELPSAVAELLSRDALIQIAAVALDYHCDHPDFDVEATGRLQGDTSARFLGQAAVDMAKSFAGWEMEPLRNSNFAAQFDALGLTTTLLGGLDGRQRNQLYAVLRRQVRRFVAQSGSRDGHGRTPGYHRPPHVLYTFFEAPLPRLADGEELLETFRLSELRAPRYALLLREHPELVGKLVVFFTLVLRHFLDTDHVPDLRPTRLVRDFMLLGIWGYDTQNLLVNLYRREGSAAVRSEIRFIGRTQLKHYRPEQDRLQEAALMRKAVSHLGPLLEPSMLRALGNFLMAYAEATQGLRNRPDSRVAVARQALEVVRETVRGGLKAGLVDVATILEVAVDGGVDGAQRALDRVDELLDRAKQDEP